MREVTLLIIQEKVLINRKLFSVFIFSFSLLFVFQTLDVSLSRLNSKTCCGRAICLCKHAPGIACPMKKLHNHHPSLEKEQPPPKKKSFSKAPCNSDTPQTILVQYAKDFLPVCLEGLSIHLPEVPAPNVLLPSLLSQTGSAIERPPQVF